MVNEMMNVRPLLRTSFKEKVLNDFEYVKKYANWIIQGSRFRNDAAWRKKVQQMYELASGKMDVEWFTHVTNPHNFTEKAHQKRPAKLEFYNVLFPIFMQLRGEYEGRSLNFMVTVEGENVTNRKTEERTKYIAQLIQEEIETAQAQAQQQGQQAPEDSETSEQKLKKFEDTYKDQAAVQGQDILEYIVARDRIKTEKLPEMWYHWLVAGEAYAYTEFKNGEMRNVCIPPLAFDYATDGESRFVDDADWCVYRQYWSPNKIVDQFYNTLTEVQLSKIETRTSANVFYDVFSDYYSVATTDYQRAVRRDRIEVVHVQMRLMKAIGVITYENEMGQKLEMQVDESYTLSTSDKEAGLKMSTMWVNEVWEIYRIDGGEATYGNALKNRSGFWLGAQPLPYQMNELNNKSECKLSFTGRRMFDMHSSPTSVVKLAMPYVKLYVIIMYRMENAVAKSKGRLAVLFEESLPQGNNGGTSMDDVLYYSEVLGIWVVSYTQMKDAGLQGQGLNNLVGSADMSHMQEVQWYIQLLEKIWSDLQRMFGMYNQRLGTPMASEGVGQVNQATLQASAATEVLFSEFEQITTRFLHNNLEISKYAYIDGKSAYFVKDDQNSPSFLDINTEDHLFSDYQVFLQQSGKENRNLEMLRQAAVGMASQHSKGSMIASMIQANSISRIKQYLREMEEEDQKRAEQQATQEQQAQENAIKIQEEYKRIETQILSDAKLKEIVAQGEQDRLTLAMQMGMETPEPVQPEDNSMKQEQNDIQRQKMQGDMTVKQQTMNFKQQELMAKLAMKKADIKKDIYKTDKQAETALKNKVAGEK
jgi:hypothetical protein